ncbi:MAG: Holliday junction branch migration DNA helicase RuvB [Patescibacteria group bacterium]
MAEEKERLVTPKVKPEEASLDITLRPKRISEYIGQEKVKSNLLIALGAAKKRSEPLEHVLLHGAPGLGKTTLAYIIGQELGVNVRITSGPALERAGDLAAILTNLQEGDILFIDEMHRLHRTIEEVLYPAMEEFSLDIIIGKGPSARTVRLDLPKFTLVGATTRVSLLSSPLRDRFGMNYRLDFYKPEDIRKIIERSAKILAINTDPDAAEEISQRARRTPRIANRLLKRVRDYADMKGDGVVTKPIATEAMEMLEIDPFGLDEIDRRILATIIEKFKGGPVGLNSIAASVGEEMETIEEVYEPFLIQLGFLARTPRGRLATDLAYQHLGIAKPDNSQPTLV